MKIIILGSGKVGRTLAEQLSNEGHNIVMVDIIAKKVQDITEDADIMGVLGNASSINTLLDAGIETADILIAVTGSDELNLLCCLIAKKCQQMSHHCQGPKPCVQQGNRVYQRASGHFHDHQSRTCRRY